MNRDAELQIETIIRLIPPQDEGFTEERARQYLARLNRRRLKRELNSAIEHTKKTRTHH